ncbi:hypothetical protein [Paraglaciecola sp. L3A3]|uniref:hypothetical protein n=1 Tax=Paraglaciecola sp. L3A3 TaxID=2686358 RepID=UPI00131C63A4|nr:hypothetical protein [Paraglaciecola sp. L3A3]
MSKLDKDQVIAAFTEAYTKANGKAPTIEAKGGWYSVDGAKNVRLAELDAQISELTSSSTATDEKPKKAASKNPKVKKTVAPKNKNKTSDFSVKAFWANKIQDNNANTKLPR